MDRVNEYRKGEYLISTNRVKLQMDVIDGFLRNESYWAQRRPRAETEKGIQNSLCYGLYDGQGVQVGFARLVTDCVTFAWLCDVFILSSHQGEGLGKWLIETIFNNPPVSEIRMAILATDDAQELYRNYAGFSEHAEPEKWMERIIKREE